CDGLVGQVSFIFTRGRWTKNAAVFVFSQKPGLVRRLFHQLLVDEAGEAIGAGDAGIIIVWPACNLRPSSM
ncbi:MAG: hypothetical protein DMF34_06020, partial [Verrucomicrobia bacterium]